METTTSYHSNFKEQDSNTECRLQRRMRSGTFTQKHAFFQMALHSNDRWRTVQTLQLDDKVTDLQYELLPLRSPLLRQSKFVSFPPLNDMLKFSGYSLVRFKCIVE